MGIPRWVYRASMRLRSLFRGTALDRELNEELQFHVDHLIETYVARGLSPDAARREALLVIGGVEQRKEDAATSEVSGSSTTFSRISNMRRGRCAALQHSRPPRS